MPARSKIAFMFVHAFGPHAWENTLPQLTVMTAKERQLRQSDHRGRVFPLLHQEVRDAHTCQGCNIGAAQSMRVTVEPEKI